MPEHRFSQDTITTALKGYWDGKLQKPELLERFSSLVGVDYRHLAFPLERYGQFTSWGETNAAWLEVAEELGVRAIDTVLDHAGMSRHDPNALFVVSITGIASPSLDARHQLHAVATGYQAYTHLWHRLCGWRHRLEPGAGLSGSGRSDPVR